MGNTLYEARIRKGLSQKDLAAHAGVSRLSVLRMEAGARIKQQNFERICSALGMAPETVLDVPIYDQVRAFAERRRLRKI